MRIKQVAKIAGISIRTLQYYDRIGLLRPLSRGINGYREYSEINLKRLQRILFLKEIGFDLKDIKGMLDIPKARQKDQFIQQRNILLLKQERMNKIINTIDNVILNFNKEKPMGEKDFQAFDLKEVEAHQEKYQTEVEQAYGNSSAYKESTKRYSQYSKQEKEQIFKNGSRIFLEISALMNEKPENSKVQSLIQEWRDHISNSFYECNLEIFKGLGQLYVADERFKKNIDKIRPGLAEYLSKAIEIYVDSHKR